MCSLVSVIIPCYNAEEFVLETIQSVLNQTYRNLELIVVDDGSTDNSLELIQSINDSRLKIIKQKNSGVSVARNKGFYTSSGDFLAFLDSDDTWHPTRIEKMLSLFSLQDIGLAHTFMEVIDSESNPQNIILKGKEGHILDSLLLWEGCNIPAPSSILIKREVINNVGLFDKELSTAADQEFFFRVAEKYKIGMIKEVLGYYRVHDNNMHSNVKRMEQDHILAYKKASLNRLFKGRKFEKRCMSNLYIILAGSWWKNGDNRLRGLYFMFRAILSYPRNIFRLASKLR